MVPDGTHRMHRGHEFCTGRHHSFTKRGTASSIKELLTPPIKRRRPPLRKATRRTPSRAPGTLGAESGAGQAHAVHRADPTTPRSPARPTSFRRPAETGISDPGNPMPLLLRWADLWGRRGLAVRRSGMSGPLPVSQSIKDVGASCQHIREVTDRAPCLIAGPLARRDGFVWSSSPRRRP